MLPISAVGVARRLNRKSDGVIAIGQADQVFAGDGAGRAIADVIEGVQGCSEVGIAQHRVDGIRAGRDVQAEIQLNVAALLFMWTLPVTSSLTSTPMAGTVSDKGMVLP